jgi:hypothetical protein
MIILVLVKNHYCLVLDESRVEEAEHLAQELSNEWRKNKIQISNPIIMRAINEGAEGGVSTEQTTETEEGEEEGEEEEGEKEGGGRVTEPPKIYIYDIETHPNEDGFM